MSRPPQTHVAPALAASELPLPATPADAEYRALLRLADLVQSGPRPRTPDQALQQLCDLGRELTEARYAALSVTDEHYHVEGFVTSGLSRSEQRRLRVPPQGHGPLGSLRTDRRPVRYDDLDTARDAFGFPPKHPMMKTMLGVPIIAAGEVRGSLYVTDRNGSLPFTDDDEAALLVIARHAGVVIERDWY